MGGIALDQAVLISMIVESLLYGNRFKYSGSFSIPNNKLWSGIFTIMIGFTFWVLIHNNSRINIKLLLASLVIYVLGTAVSQLRVESIARIIHLMLDCIKHLTTDAYRIVKAFITYRDSQGGPIAYLTNLSSTSYLLKSSFYTLQTLVGDFYMVRKYHYSSSLRHP